MTIEEYRKLCHKASSRKNKYGALRSGGYASGKEHSRACQLKLLQSAGQISDLRQQVRFVLVPTQRDCHGNLVERSCSYIADFVYLDRDGNLVVEDTKGFRTKEYIIKRKLMLYLHGIKILEI